MRKTEVKIKIRNYHSDNQNHVNNARYLEFYEEGSWDFLEKNKNVGKLMKTLAEDGIVHVAVNINCNFRNSAVVGDTLRIETELCRSTNRSFTWLKKVFNDKSDILVTDAENKNMINSDFRMKPSSFERCRNLGDYIIHGSIPKVVTL